MERGALKRTERGGLPRWNTMERNPVGQWAFCCSLEFLLLPYSSSVLHGFCCNTRDIFTQTNTQRINEEKWTLKVTSRHANHWRYASTSETGTKLTQVQHGASWNVNYRTTYNSTRKCFYCIVYIYVYIHIYIMHVCIYTYSYVCVYILFIK